MREKRVLDEVDRLLVERQGAKSADCVALSEQLEESHEQQQHLREAVSEGEGLVSDLRGQLEGCQAENEELRAGLDLLRIKPLRGGTRASSLCTLQQHYEGTRDPSTDPVRLLGKEAIHSWWEL